MPIHCLGFGLVTCDRLLLFDNFPLPNQKLVVDRWTEQVGGPVAVGLMTMAALGLRVHWGPPLGSDGNSQRVKTQFQDLGIGFKEITTRQDAVATPEAIILVDRQSGARTVLLCAPSHNPDLQPITQVTLQLLAAQWLYHDGRNVELSLALNDWAKKNQTKVFLDLGNLRPQWQEIVNSADIVIVSDDFMRQLDATLTPEAMLQRLAACQVKIAGLTLGEQGSIFLEGENFLKIAPVPRQPVKDSTNAGDVFHGAFLAAWIKTQSVAKSAEFASRCAAWTVGQIGHNLQCLPVEIRQEFENLQWM